MNLQFKGTYHFPGKTDTMTYSEKYHKKVAKLWCLKIILSASRQKKLPEELIRLASDQSNSQGWNTMQQCLMELWGGWGT